MSIKRKILVLLSFTILVIGVVPVVKAQEIIHYVSTWGGTYSEYVGSVIVDNAGNVYVTGYTYSFGLGSSDFYLLKYNSTGSLTWQRTWGGGGFDGAAGIGIAPSGHVYVAGNTDGFGAGRTDVVLLEYDPDGNIVKQQTWGGTGVETLSDMAVAADGSVYLVGSTNSTGAGSFDQLVLKFDSTGNLVWQRTWGGVKRDFAIGAGVDPAGNIYVAGETNSTGGGSFDATLLKFDPAGTLLRQRAWGGAGIDFLWDVSVDASGQPTSREEQVHLEGNPMRYCSV